MSNQIAKFNKLKVKFQLNEYCINTTLMQSQCTVWTDKKEAHNILKKHKYLIQQCYIIDFTVHVSSHFLQSILHCSCFILYPSVHTSLIMFHFYFLQSTVHLIHFIYHSPTNSYLHTVPWDLCDPMHMRRHTHK